jgi:hypothetical protein
MIPFLTVRQKIQVREYKNVKTWLKISEYSASGPVLLRFSLTTRQQKEKSDRSGPWQDFRGSFESHETLSKSNANLSATNSPKLRLFTAPAGV